MTPASPVGLYSIINLMLAGIYFAGAGAVLLAGPQSDRWLMAVFSARSVLAGISGLLVALLFHGTSISDAQWLMDLRLLLLVVGAALDVAIIRRLTGYRSTAVVMTMYVTFATVGLLVLFGVELADRVTALTPTRMPWRETLMMPTLVAIPAFAMLFTAVSLVKNVWDFVAVWHMRMHDRTGAIMLFSASLATIFFGFFNLRYASHDIPLPFLGALTWIPWTVLLVFLLVRQHRQDLTARMRLEQNVRQSQKMESLGRLAGGLAHDFNNLLTVIKACTHSLLDTIPAPQPHRQEVEEIDRAVERAATLTRQLLTYTRQTEAARHPILIDTVLQDTERMLRRLLPRNITLVVEVRAREARVSGNTEQLLQVMLNLALNARDAMPSGGTLRMSTALEDTAPTDALGPARRVMVTVSDTGTGMSPAVQQQIFEPFFTTKALGEGTGLGLAVAHGIITAHDGRITVDSTPNAGTTFCLLLPLLVQAEHEPATEPVPPKVDRAVASATNASVLIVDDEPAVLKVTARLVRQLGYHVQTAERGVEALDIIRHEPNTISLLLTDVLMPGMNGVELVAQVRAINPEIRVLYMSGYTADALASSPIDETSAALLLKPFSRDTMADALRGALAAM